MDSKTDSIIFSHNDLMSSSFSAFEAMRKKGDLIDFKIDFENRSISGHRLVLAAAIPYFRVGDPEEESTLRKIDPDALESVIDFAYSGKMKISSENIQLLFTASESLQLSQVFNFCCEFLLKQLRPNNAWEKRTLAENHHWVKLMGVIDQYILQHFEAFSKSESFTTLPFSYLKQIISQDDMKVSSEEIVFEAVIRWVEISAERRDNLHELLLCVRMTQIIPRYLVERVSNEQLMQTVDSCKELVEEAKLYHLVPEKISENCIFTIRPRIYQPITAGAEARGVYAVCEFQSGLSVKFLDLENHNWVNVSTAAIKGIDKVAACGGIIYAFSDNRVELFNVKTLKWDLLNPVHENLMRSGVVVHSKKIYFFGGLPEGSDVVRCFSPQWNEWLPEGKMSRRLDFPGVASSAKYIYVTGGALESVVYKSAERYNPIKKEWIDISPMLAQRYCHGCTSLNGKIYVCGGSDDKKFLDTAEMYDPFMNQWNSIASLKSPRTSFSIVSHNDKIYALGGLTENCTTAVNMEIYDSVENEWKSGVHISAENNCEIFLIRGMVPSKNYNRVDSKTSVLPLIKDRKDDFRTCDNCGKRGHLKAQCYKIAPHFSHSQPGHMALDVNKNTQKIVRCFKCGKTGHVIRDCPFYDSDDRLCYYCGNLGHFQRDCPFTKSGDKTLHPCGKSGQFVYDRLSPEHGDKKCFHCGRSGHIARNCFSKRKYYSCGKSDHFAHNCTSSGSDDQASGDCLQN